MTNKLFISFELTNKLIKSSDNGCTDRFTKGTLTLKKIFMLEHTPYFITSIGSSSHRLDNSHQYVFILIPVDEYNGSKKYQYNRGDDAEGLVVSCKNNEYVIVREDHAYIDISTVPLVSDEFQVMDAEKALTGYWRGLSELEGIYKEGSVAYTKHVEHNNGCTKDIYMAYVESKGQYANIYLGDNMSQVKEVSQQAAGALTEHEGALNDLVSKKITNEEQLSLF
jgi:hypothetical protein